MGLSTLCACVSSRPTVSKSGGSTVKKLDWLELLGEIDPESGFSCWSVRFTPESRLTRSGLIFGTPFFILTIKLTVLPSPYCIVIDSRLKVLSLTSLLPRFVQQFGITDPFDHLTYTSRCPSERRWRTPERLQKELKVIKLFESWISTESTEVHMIVVLRVKQRPSMQYRICMHMRSPDADWVLAGVNGRLRAEYWNSEN